jgi:hypothetical protein
MSLVSHVIVHAMPSLSRIFSLDSLCVSLVFFLMFATVFFRAHLWSRVSLFLLLFSVQCCDFFSPRVSKSLKDNYFIRRLCFPVLIFVHSLSLFVISFSSSFPFLSFFVSLSCHCCCGLLLASSMAESSRCFRNGAESS